MQKEREAGQCGRVTLAADAASPAARTPPWELRPPSIPPAVYLDAGLGVPVAVEWVRVRRRERWSYSGTMPLLLGVSLSPLVRWAAVPLLTLWLTRRHIGVPRD